MYGLTTSPCTIQSSIGTFRTKARSLVQPEEGNTRLKERKAWIRKEENWRAELNPRSSAKSNVCSIDVHRQLHSPEHAARSTVTNSTPAGVHP